MPTATVAASRLPPTSSTATLSSNKTDSMPATRRAPLQDRLQPRSASHAPGTSLLTVRRIDEVNGVGHKQVMQPSAAMFPPSRRRAADSRVSSQSSRALYRGSPSRCPSPPSAPRVSSPPAAVSSPRPNGAICQDRIALTIPQRLPRPPIQVISNPHLDLAQHLRRHGLEADAKAVQTSGMPGDFLLDAYLEAGRMGKSNLHQQTADFVPRLRNQIQAQVQQGAKLPASLQLDTTLDSCGSYLPPTHVLAIFSGTDETILVAAHDLVLALQCTSIPFLPPVVRGRKPSEARLPVVPLCLPHPSAFDSVHKWLYSPDSPCLFEDLIPMAFVVRLLATLSNERYQRDELASLSLLEMDNVGARLKVSLALSYLATSTLLDVLKRIQAVWKNGAAMGITSLRFWGQLDKAWESVLGALVEAKRRKAALAASGADKAADALERAAI
ncbi:uncharacterized protein PSFLO_02279 [Pseudozyma flocculosa]|uniref:Uncharacterized protein n=1 Tax=Pseudozyma flocculosa TaxID=84751 RepID=A0A5C3EX62_9BASI|nr:uncharacterized protein PSFLO_02279 [Pseudozyma flocculosa]